MKEGPKFLSRDQLEEKADRWKIDANFNESDRFRYQAGRPGDIDIEGVVDSVTSLHGISFIREIIPELIKNKKGGEKVKILDIGAGATIFTEEIRKIFGDKVKVYSTGLSKAAAKHYREDRRGENNFKLHPDDLKWRSVLELSDFPEFDLITDTFGEYSYMTNPLVEGYEKSIKKIVQYLEAVIKKLKLGGMASISPLGTFYRTPNIMGVIKNMEKIFPGVEISFPEIGNQNGINAIRIRKIK